MSKHVEFLRECFRLAGKAAPCWLKLQLRYGRVPVLRPKKLRAALVPAIAARAHYGGEAIFCCCRASGICHLEVIATVMAPLLKLGTRAEQVYGQGDHSFLKKAGIGAVVFAAIYFLAPIGSQ